MIGLHIDVEEIENRVILRIDGRLDAATSVILERKIDALLEEHRHHLLLDFTHVDYMSSAGMRLLLATAKKLKQKKGDLLLFSLNDDVMEIVKMAGFDRVLHICATEKEALQTNQ
jgi:anti-sigma B factor antagonist/stage II sporulation protein AA (anti-sigma F factor antagonist)